MSDFYVVGETWKFELRGDENIFYTGKILKVSDSQVKILDKYGKERILNFEEIKQAWKEA